MNFGSIPVEQTTNLGRIHCRFSQDHQYDFILYSLFKYSDFEILVVMFCVSGNHFVVIGDSEIEQEDCSNYSYSTYEGLIDGGGEFAT